MKATKKTASNIAVKVKEYYKDFNSNVPGAAAVNAGLITLAFNILINAKKDGWAIVTKIPEFLPQALTNSVITFASTFIAQSEVKAVTEALSDKNKEETVEKMGVESIKVKNASDFI